MAEQKNLKQIKTEVKDALKKKEWDRGIVLLREWCAQKPDDARGWYYLAYFLMKTERFQEAKANAARAIEIDPDNEEALKLNALLNKQAAAKRHDRAVSKGRLWDDQKLVQGRYEVRGSKEGGMGKVYFAYDYDLDQMVAVKAPLPSALETEDKKARFFREAEAWMGLGMHPNICTAHYVQEMEGIPWLFIEYVDGGTLQDWLKKQDLTFKDRLDIAIQIASGMNHTHTFFWRDEDGANHRGLVHRDLKPANVLMTSDGIAKVTDFGLVGLGTAAPDRKELFYEQEMNGAATDTTRKLSAGSIIWEIASDVHWKTITVSGGALGTPPYMAPEQWMSSHVAGFPVDVYAFGCILYDIFCGRRPFVLDEKYRHAMPVHKLFQWEKMHLEEQPPDPLLLTPDLDEELAELMLACMEKEASGRPENFEAITGVLKSIYSRVMNEDYPRPEPRSSRLVSDSLNNQGVSYMTIGQNKRAVLAWQEALKNDPHHIEATFNMAVLEWNNGLIGFGEVFRRMEEVGRTHTSMWRHKQLAGIMYLAFGEYTRAVTYFQQANRLIHPGMKELKDLGLALCAEAAASRDSAHWKDAEKCFRKILDSDYSDSIVITAYALTLKRQGRKDEAVRYYLTAAAKLEDMPAGLEEAIHRFLPGQEIIGTVVHAGGVHYLGFTRNGRCALIGGSNKISTWTIKPGAEFNSTGPEEAQPDPDSMSTWDIILGQSIKERYLMGASAFSMDVYPTGGKAVTGNGEGEVQIWKISDGSCEKTMHGHIGPVRAVRFSRNGQSVLSGGDDGVVRLWEAATGECFQTYEGHESGISAVILSPNELNAVSAGEDNTIRLWDAYSEKCIQIFQGHTGRINAMAYRRDGRYIASAGDDRSVRIWDIQNGRCLRHFEGRDAKINCLSFSPDGRFIISGGDDKTVCIWNIQADRLERVFRFENRVEDLAMSRDSQFILVAHASPELPDAKDVSLVEFPVDNKNLLPYMVTMPISSTIADERETEFISRIEEAKSRLQEEDYSKVLVALGQARDIPGYARDGEALQLWRELIPRFPTLRLRTAWELETLQGHEGGVNSLSGFISGSRILSGGADGFIRLWDMRSGICERSFSGGGGPVNCAVLLADGRQAVTSGDDGAIKLWDMEAGESFRVLIGHEEPVLALAVSPDGRYAISSAGDGKALFWDLVSCVIMRPIEGHTGMVTAAAFSSDGKLAATGGEDSTVRIIEMQSGKCIRILEGHRKPVSALSFSPDNRFIMSGCEDAVVRRWELANETRHESFMGHSDAVTSVDFCPDGRYALSGSEDKTIRLWDLRDGKCIRIFEGHAAGVSSVVFSPDRQMIVTASRDSFLRLWRLDWQPDIKEQALWDPGALPYLETFLALHTPYSAGSLARSGKPKWDDEDFSRLLNELNNRGYGWLLPRGVKAELKQTAEFRKSLSEILDSVIDKIKRIDLRALVQGGVKKVFFILLRLVPAALWTVLLIKNDMFGLSTFTAVITVLFFALIMFRKKK